jgi:hypothetical protein
LVAVVAEVVADVEEVAADVEVAAVDVEEADVADAGAVLAVAAAGRLCSEHAFLVETEHTAYAAWGFVPAPDLEPPASFDVVAVGPVLVDLWASDECVLVVVLVTSAWPLL